MEKFFNYAIEKYKFLEPVFFCDHGISLFYIDSEIARSIMKVFLDREKPILPIHDGFVVKLQDEDLLFNTMQNVWKDRFGTDIQIKKEWGGKDYDYPSYADMIHDKYEEIRDLQEMRSVIFRDRIRFSR